MSKALVVLSGGQDSTTCLFFAKRIHDQVHAITFDYNQRHARELAAAEKVAQLAGVVSHEVIELGPVLQGSSPLVSDNPVGHYTSDKALPGGVEPTFVPGRNMLFLSIAANRAAVLGATEIFTGVCQADFGGYFDCRRVFIDAMETAVNQALHGCPTRVVSIITPLMFLSKAEAVRLAKTMPDCWEALAWTHTCYDGSYPPNPFNHASLLRARGFHDAGLPDPLIERAIAEGLLPTDYPTDGRVEGTPYADPVTWTEEVAPSPKPRRTPPKKNPRS